MGLYYTSFYYIYGESMSEIIKYFQLITQIPHCSKEADRLLEFLVGFAKEREYEVEIDKAKNIYIHKGNPTLCLQAHYDMVCMGRAPNIETYIEDGIMRAKDSSLGADNGIAIAMMMQLMDEKKELEFLLTSDEEIGLIGANEVSFNLNSKYMLNLDSEDEAEVYIGCAGGADLVARKVDKFEDGTGDCYEIAVRGLAGGHSGVDIDKGIPSAIKLLGRYLAESEITQIASIYAGERRNSIPANAVAVVYSQKELKNSDNVEARKLKERPKVLKQSKELIRLIDEFRHGVLGVDDKFNIPSISINLAIINTDEKGGVKIEASGRAMSIEALEYLNSSTKKFFEHFGFDVTIEDKYPAWKPEINEFTNIVSQEMKSVFGKTKNMAIHAGLECGVLASKYPHIKFASIGPTIRYPHSTREEVDLNSVERTFEVLLRVVNRVST
jgi:dipeptidase D